MSTSLYRFSPVIAAKIYRSTNIYVDICDKAAAVWFYLHLLFGNKERSDFTHSPTFSSKNVKGSHV